MGGLPDELFGPPTPAKPIGRGRPTPAVSPGRLPFDWPEREQDATERFYEDCTEAEDEGPDYEWTPRHERVPGL